MSDELRRRTSQSFVPRPARQSYALATGKDLLASFARGSDAFETRVRPWFLLVEGAFSGSSIRTEKYYSFI